MRTVGSYYHKGFTVTIYAKKVSETETVYTPTIVLEDADHVPDPLALALGPSISYEHAKDMTNKALDVLTAHCAMILVATAGMFKHSLPGMGVVGDTE